MSRAAGSPSRPGGGPPDARLAWSGYAGVGSWVGVLAMRLLLKRSGAQEWVPRRVAFTRGGAAEVSSVARAAFGAWLGCRSRVSLSSRNLPEGCG